MESNVDRKVGFSAVKPIVYGNSAEWLPQKTAGGHTHRWRMFLRPYFNEDISKYVKKVQFRLHESYDNPVRTLETPPYEIEETGWGEFEASIKIFFVDPNEKPVTALYYLRLFAPVVTDHNRQIVLNEYYDEIVFVEPTKLMMRALEAGTRDKPIKSATDFHAQKQAVMDKINYALKDVNQEINDLRDSFKQLQNEASKPAEDSRAASAEGSVDSGMEH